MLVCKRNQNHQVALRSRLLIGALLGLLVLTHGVENGRASTHSRHAGISTRIGFVYGMSTSSIDGLEGFDSRSAAAFQAFLDTPLSANVGIRYFGAFYGGGVRYESEYGTSGIELSYTEVGASLLLLLGSRDGGLEISAGPGIATLMDAKLVEEESGLSLDAMELFESTSFGLNLGADLRIKWVILAVDTHIGFSDVLANPTLEGKNRSTRLSAGLSLPIG